MDSCILILCIDFLNTLINSSKFLWRFFLGFWCIGSHHQRIGIILLPPFPFHTHFISFSCLITLAIVSNTSQDNSTENRHPWLIPNVRGNAQVLFNTIMPKCLSQPPFCWNKIFPYLFCTVFKNYVMVLNCYQMFSLHIMRWSYDAYYSFNCYNLLF